LGEQLILSEAERRSTCLNYLPSTTVKTKVQAKRKNIIPLPLIKKKEKQKHKLGKKEK